MLVIIKEDSKGDTGNLEDYQRKHKLRVEGNTTYVNRQLSS